MNTGPLGAVRVGAEGGLAARHLAPNARSLAMLGSGRQARTQMSAVCAALPGLEADVTRRLSTAQARVRRLDAEPATGAVRLAIEELERS